MAPLQELIHYSSMCLSASFPFEWCSPPMKLSDGPEVLEEMSFPRPRNPVVTAGSPSFASALALFGTRISASSILGVFYGLVILVVVMVMVFWRFVLLFIFCCFYQVRVRSSMSFVNYYCGSGWACRGRRMGPPYGSNGATSQTVLNCICRGRPWW